MHALDLRHRLVQIINLIVRRVRIIIPSVSFVGIKDWHVWIGLYELLLDFHPLNH